MGLMSPLGVGSTPPMSPNGNMWQNKFVNVTPPALQLPGSHLKTSLNSRDLEMELELLQRQQMIDNLSTNLYNNRFGEMKPTNLDDVYGSNLLGNKFGKTLTRLRSSFGFDSSAAVAQAVMNSRSGLLAKQRSQSFNDRGVGNPSLRSLTQSSTYSEWGSPDGKLDWGFNSEDANKLRKSASFGFRNGTSGFPLKANHEPDDLWAGAGLYSSSETFPSGLSRCTLSKKN